MYWYTFSQSSCPCIADAKPRKKNAYIHIPQTSTVAMPMTISWSCEVPVRQEQSAVNSLNMLRLSPPALTAGLHRSFGVGLHFRSGVPGFRPCTAYGCRLRTDGKFMIYFTQQTKYHTVFSQKQKFGRCLANRKIQGVCQRSIKFAQTIGEQRFTLPAR